MMLPSWLVGLRLRRARFHAAQVFAKREDLHGVESHAS
jgi:hypothetical protein